MGNKTSTSDLARRLGLKWAITRKTEDALLCQEVQQLYDAELNPILGRYLHLDNAGLRACESLINELNALLTKYGPVVWRHGKYRYWLFQTDDERTNGLYQRQLYYESPEDRQFIHDTFREIGMLKAIRKRNDRNSMLAQQSVRPTTSPEARDPEPGPSRRVGSSPDVRHPLKRLPTESDSYEALATSTADLGRKEERSIASLQDGTTAEAELGCAHLNVSQLHQLGVWFGDVNNEHAVILGNPSWDAVRYQWDKRTANRNMRDISPNELQTLQLHSEHPRSVKCVECATNARSNAQVLKLKVLPFLPAEQPASTRTFQRMVWTLEWEVDNRTVFAMVRCEKQRRLGATFYTFWKATGGYTQDAGVITTREGPDGDLLGGFIEHMMDRSPGKRRRSESSEDSTQSNARAADEELEACMGGGAYVDSVADDADQESLWRPSPPLAKMAKRDSSGRFRPAQIPSRTSSAVKQPYDIGHLRDTIPVSQPRTPASPQPQHTRTEHPPPRVGVGTPIPAAHERSASPRSARPPLIRIRLQIKGRPMTYTLDLHDETVTDFFATVAHGPPFRQSIGRSSRIASIIMSVHDRDEAFMHWIDAHADAGFEEMLSDARKLAHSAVDRKVVLRGEIELED